MLDCYQLVWETPEQLASRGLDEIQLLCANGVPVLRMPWPRLLKRIRSAFGTIQRNTRILMADS